MQLNIDILYERFKGLKLQEFHEAEAIIKFCRLINNIFDILRIF